MNVYLAENKVAVCEQGTQQFPIIPSILNLYEKIAEAAALKPHPLTSAEIKFLRQQLGLTAAQWAFYLNDKTNISRWENDHATLSSRSDALIRYLYFRLLEEKENRHIGADISGRISNVEKGNDEELGFKFPANNPSAYSFPPTSLLDAAAI